MCEISGFCKLPFPLETAGDSATWQEQEGQEGKMLAGRALQTLLEVGGGRAGAVPRVLQSRAWSSRCLSSKRKPSFYLTFLHT